jgi:molecular chaperone DnaJ
VDAWVEIPVNLAQLILGSAMRLRTPDGGRVLVRIRQGTQPEAILRVPRHGYVEGEHRGDLFIRLRLAIPTQLNEEQDEAVRLLAARMGWRF